MPDIYVSKLNVQELDLDDEQARREVQQAIIDEGFTHVKDRQGKVWKFMPKLNKKSVALNHAGEGPQRITFDRVVSFGTMEEMHTQSDKAAGQKLAKDDKVLDISHSGRSHALLSASGAHRWLNCTPSARLEDQAPNEESEAAAEGTAAHELAEHKLRRALNQRSKRPVSAYNDDDMEDHTDAYLRYILDRWVDAQKADPAAIIDLEQRLDFSRWVPDGFGTGDCIIAAADTLTIIDFKYGAGVPVDATMNPQMMLYALGALDQLDFLFDFEQVTMVIYQPRRENISEFTLPVSELLDWAENAVKPAATLAADGAGDFHPGTWCQFCNVSATCRARAEKNLEIAEGEFTNPELLSDEEIARILERLPEVKAWISDVEKFTTSEAVEHGRVWPGFKLVAGRAVRKFTDPDAVAAAAQAAGFVDIYDRKLITLTAMEKLMGRPTFREVLGDLVHKPEGKPTLVPDSDPRPTVAAHDAATDFSEIN